MDGLASSKLCTTNLEPGWYIVCDKSVIGQPSTGLKSTLRTIPVKTQLNADETKLLQLPEATAIAVTTVVINPFIITIARLSLLN